MHERRIRRAGYSAVEMVVAVAIFALIFGAIWSTLNEGTQHAAHAVERTNVEERARSSLMRITDELRNSGSDIGGTDHVLSHPRAVATDQPFLIFEERIGLDSTAADWAPRVDYFLRPSPGENPTNLIDDDGDGLIDERELARLQSGITNVIADDVLEFRAMRAAGSDSISLRLVVARPDPTSPEMIRAEIATRIALRNVPQF